MRVLLTTIRRNWLWILLAVVVASVAVGVLSARSAPEYRADARVLASDTDFAALFTGTNLEFDPAPQRTLATQRELASLPVVAQRVARELGIEDYKDVVGSVTVTDDRLTDVIGISAVADDPADAVAMSNAFARQFVTWRRAIESAAVGRAIAALERTIDETRASTDPGAAALADSLETRLQRLRVIESLETGGVSLVQTAVEAERVGPSPVRDAIMAAILVLFLTVGLLVARDLLDTRLRSPEEISAVVGRPVLGHPIGPKDAARPLISAEADGYARAESFRSLRVAMDLARPEGVGTRLAVVGAHPGDGKSTTAANLALIAAEHGLAVILVDADLRSPSLATMFGIPPSDQGLSTCIRDPRSVPHALVEIETEAATPDEHRRGSLHVLPAGPRCPNPGEFIASQRMGDVLDLLDERADLVVIDTPPLLAAADASLLARASSGVLLVSKCPAARRPLLAALGLLPTEHDVLLGIAITHTGRDAIDPYGYGRGYGYGRRYGYGAPSGDEAASTAPNGSATT